MVHKRFYFHFGRNEIADFLYLVKREFPCHDEAFYPQIAVKLCRVFIGKVCLRGQVNFKIGRVLADYAYDAHIADYHAVDAALFQEKYYVRHSTEICVMCENIERNVHFFAFFVTILHRFAKFVRVEVVGKSAQSELLIRKINRVCTEVDRGFKFFDISRRSEQFYFFSHVFFTDSDIPSPTGRTLVE